ncbi:MAG: hypothetical protein Fur0018_17120 [Anaerolineales bacterium]
MDISAPLAHAIERRAAWLTPPHEGAFRLFNGYTEGLPGLRIEIFARTAVIFNLAHPPESLAAPVQQAVESLPPSLPWLESILLKTRHSGDEAARLGVLVWGEHLPARVRERHVRYALDLRLNQDAGFYVDTRALRAWLLENMAGKQVLNTFAYTGVLGVAALAGGAARVVQTDLNRRFLNLAKESCTLNGLPIRKEDYQTGDFFSVTARLRRARQRFDCVILDPPFFSQTRKGRVDLQHDYRALMNKIRPLIAPGGWLVAVNNALYLSGAAFKETLDSICAQGVLRLERLIPIPEDCTGGSDSPTGGSVYPEDPSPFNHPTKIAILRSDES